MVHPCVLERCKELVEFQEQLIQLAIDSVQQTFGPLPWKKGAFCRKGGWKAVAGEG